jgi:hypothetical protein
LKSYFFLDFLAFFAFFAFFAFLAMVSSQGLMDGNATRGMLGGGPASQHPRMQSQQIRGALPVLSRACHRVIHSCYAFWSIFRRCEALRAEKILIHANDRSSRATPAGLTMRQRGGGFCIDPEQAEGDAPAIFINSKPQRRLPRRGESPLSGVAAL